MMGSMGPIANFDVTIGNHIENIIYMIGYSKLKLTFMLNEWAVLQRMARR